MSDAPERLFELVSQRSGSALSRQQRERVAAAAERLKGARTWAGFVDTLDSRARALELLELLSSASVHKTDLFRDEAQLDALERHVLAPLAATGRPLQLWSAGCATGEEVATLLLLLARVGANPASRVLGTDLSGAALTQARALTFSAEVMKRVPAAERERWFQQSGEGFVLDRRLAASARFERHNLVETPYPFPDVGPAFDVIVCRNVLIYFTAEAAERTVGLLAERLGAGGTLVLSAAEPILKPRPELETLRVGGTFFYRPRRAPVSEAPSPPTHQPPVPPPRPSAPVPVDPQRFTPCSPVDEGVELFSLVLEWSAAGQADEETAAGLRKALYLAPDLAAARYCLGLLLEQQGRRADATTEYRRAVASLEAGRAPPTAFFLNVERLERACRVALDRLTRF